jgi:imidazolonepropionase-like amidohydrolase
MPLREEPGLPTILASGPPLTRDAGHCWYLGGCCDGPAALVAAVRDRQQRGCDVVKIMVTGGANTAGFQMWDTQFVADEVKAVVDVAHEVGLPVAAHCHGTEGIAIAVEGRVDTIEHCSFFTGSGRSEPDADVVAAIVDTGIAVSATVGRHPGFAPPPIVAANYDTIVSGYRMIHEAGGTLVAGTDAGIAPPKPHDILPHAARDLMTIGMTGMEVLSTLTSVAARACSVADRKGRLATGLDADLIAVAGDPASQPEALCDVRAVWRAGRRIR